METVDEMKSLAERLGISPDEVKKTAARLKFMKQVKENNGIDLGVIDQVFDEWKALARRLRKGGEMLEQTEDEKRSAAIFNLYNFLLVQLGLYDEFFRSSLNESHYKSLQKSILNILNKDT